MSNEWESLNHDDVVSVNPKTFENLDISNTFKVVELLEIIKAYSNVDGNEASLFGKGIDCEVLKPGTKGWQKGKVTITLQFCPERDLETTSPLDDIRQNLKQTES